eukprot:3546129-Pleurochrysis_carterae.AAC.2
MRACVRARACVRVRACARARARARRSLRACEGGKTIRAPFAPALLLTRGSIELGSVRPNLSSAAADLNTYRV